MLLTVFFFFSVGGRDGGRGDLVVGALSVAREGRVPLLVLLAVFARAYVDVAAKIALDRAVAVFGPARNGRRRSSRVVDTPTQAAEELRRLPRLMMKTG